jgi:hypothetical protein
MPLAPSTTTGRLQIGDQWNAITIIAHSQTHPLKAICELTENAIDAGARHVRIVRRRSKGQLYLELEDDGRGVAADESGLPDFQRIATHLCDSMKRHLTATQRRGVHGEFGIGLLSFWSLGEELRMTSGGNGTPLRELCLVRGQQEYEIRPVKGRLATVGTRVVVGPLLDATKNLVADPVARRQMRVTPREFEGERLEIPRRYATPLGDVSVEIYARADDATDPAGIALCKDGTRVLATVTELLPFQHAPWNDRRLVGLVDFEPLTLAPGTRSGVVPDAAFEALVAVAPAIERDILETLATREQAEAERASRQLLKQVHKAFASALADLPAEDYLFFDIPKQSPVLQSNAGGAGESLAFRGAAAVGGPTGPTDPRAAPTLFAVEPGPLATIRITPRHPRRPPGRGCRLMATAIDAQGVEVVAGLVWSWKVVAGAATLEPDGEACVVTSATTGMVVVEAVARQFLIEATDRVDVKFVEPTQGEGDGGRGLPSYRLEAEHGQPWRSRYDSAANEIVINSAHRDFLASRSSPARHRRYIGKLYGKEVVLTNFPHESPAEVMERLIEVTLRTEDAL